jgi:hypothetical protein
MERDLCGERGMRSLRRGLESGVTAFAVRGKVTIWQAFRGGFALQVPWNNEFR